MVVIVIGLAAAGHYWKRPSEGLVRILTPCHFSPETGFLVAMGLLDIFSAAVKLQVEA